MSSTVKISIKENEKIVKIGIKENVSITKLIVKDSGGVKINITDIPAKLVQTPASYIVKYANGQLITSGTIPPGVTKPITIQNCPDGSGGITYEILDSASNVLYSGSVAAGGNLSQAINDSVATLKDSAGNVLSTTNLLAEGTADIVAPDSTITVNGNAFGNALSGGALDVPVEYENGTPVGTIVGGVVEIPDPITPSGIAYQRPMMTGQTTIYRTGDDAWAVINRPPPPNPTNPIYWAELVDFFTLKNNNFFGNKNRFTDENGLQIYGNNYVIDHYTGIGRYRLLQGGSTIWNTSVDSCLSSTQNGFNDWFLENRFQIASIIYHELSDCLNYSPFSIVIPNIIWTSTTIKSSTTSAYSFSFNSVLGGADKSLINTRHYLLTRWHF